MLCERQKQNEFEFIEKRKAGPQYPFDRIHRFTSANSAKTTHTEMLVIL